MCFLHQWHFFLKFNKHITNRLNTKEQIDKEDKENTSDYFLLEDDIDIY